MLSFFGSRHCGASCEDSALRLAVVRVCKIDDTWGVIRGPALQIYTLETCCCHWHSHSQRSCTPLSAHPRHGFPRARCTIWDKSPHSCYRPLGKNRRREPMRARHGRPEKVGNPQPASRRRCPWPWEAKPAGARRAVASFRTWGRGWRRGEPARLAFRLHNLPVRAPDCLALALALLLSLCRCSLCSMCCCPTPSLFGLSIPSIEDNSPKLLSPKLPMQCNALLCNPVRS